LPVVSSAEAVLRPSYEFRSIHSISNTRLAQTSRASLAVLFVTVMMSLPVSATTVLNRTVPEMTGVSELVLSGVVVSVEPNRSAVGYPLATRVTVAVDRVYKGFASGPTIRFMVPGGVRDGKAMFIPGMPSFIEGEEVVLFLERTPGGWIPSGLKNGKYVVNEDANGRRLVWREAVDLTRVARDRSLTREAAAESDVMTLDELEALIKTGLECEVDEPSVVSGQEGGAR